MDVLQLWRKAIIDRLLIITDQEQRKMIEQFFYDVHLLIEGSKVTWLFLDQETYNKFASYAVGLFDCIKKLLNNESMSFNLLMSNTLEIEDLILKQQIFSSEVKHQVSLQLQPDESTSKLNDLQGVPLIHGYDAQALQSLDHSWFYEPEDLSKEESSDLSAIEDSQNQAESTSSFVDNQESNSDVGEVATLEQDGSDTNQVTEPLAQGSEDLLYASEPQTVASEVNNNGAYNIGLQNQFSQNNFQVQVPSNYASSMQSNNHGMQWEQQKSQVQSQSIPPSPTFVEEYEVTQSDLDDTPYWVNRQFVSFIPAEFVPEPTEEVIYKNAEDYLDFVSTTDSEVALDHAQDSWYAPKGYQEHSFGNEVPHQFESRGNSAYDLSTSSQTRDENISNNFYNNNNLNQRDTVNVPCQPLSQIRGHKDLIKLQRQNQAPRFSPSVNKIDAHVEQMDLAEKNNIINQAVYIIQNQDPDKIAMICSAQPKQSLCDMIDFGNLPIDKLIEEDASVKDYLIEVLNETYASNLEKQKAKEDRGFVLLPQALADLNKKNKGKNRNAKPTVAELVENLDNPKVMDFNSPLDIAKTIQQVKQDTFRAELDKQLAKHNLSSVLGQEQKKEALEKERLLHSSKLEDAATGKLGRQNSFHFHEDNDSEDGANLVSLDALDRPPKQYVPLNHEHRQKRFVSDNPILNNLVDNISKSNKERDKQASLGRSGSGMHMTQEQAKQQAAQDAFLENFSNTMHAQVMQKVRSEYDVYAHEDPFYKTPEVDENAGKVSLDDFDNYVGSSALSKKLAKAEADIDNDRMILTHRQIKPNKTFESFVTSQENSLVVASAIAVASSPGRERYNPFYIYGGSGLGKTHILNAIANFILRDQPSANLVFINAEDFINHYVVSFKNNKGDDRQLFFQKFYIDRQILIIDDIQGLSKAEKTRNAFFEIIAAFIEKPESQLILASDVAPTFLTGFGFHPRLTSRFGSGVCLPMSEPTEQARTAIILKKCKEFKIFLPDAVVRYLAANMPTNVREIEGTLKTLNVFLDAYQTIRVEDVKALVAGGKLQLKPVLDLNYIKKRVAEYFNVSIEDMTSTSKVKKVSLARAMAMTLARESALHVSLNDIGKIFSKDHSTVHESIKRMKKKIQTDPSVEKDFQTLFDEFDKMPKP